MSECGKYGMIDSCNKYCPVYKRGECDNEDAKNALFLMNKQVAVHTEEESKLVQKRAFELGWSWPTGGSTYRRIVDVYIILWGDRTLNYSELGNDHCESISIDFFTKNNSSILNTSLIIENSIKTLKDKLKRI